MTPYDRIRAAYIANANPAGVTWEELVGFHLASPECYIIKHPDFFVLARAVDKRAPAAAIHDLTHEFAPDDRNTWHLWAFAGDMAKCLASMPYELPWVAWERYAPSQNDLRFVSTTSIRRLLLSK